MENFVTVKDLIDNTRLKVVEGKDWLDRKITVPDISRPGLSMTGFFNYYEPKRVQLFGVNEISFSKTMSHERKVEIFNKMATSDTPAFVVSTDLEIPQELKDAAKNHEVPLLTTSLTSSRILSNMTYYLGSMLSKRETVHGVLIDINGLGVLITGDAGVGKTESALELIQQNKARLIADDRVDVYQQDEQRLVGTSPEVLKNLMEVRGVGIIDIMQTYGAEAIRTHSSISLNIYLSQANIDSTDYDRLGDKKNSLKILGVSIPKMIVPVAPGRNTASVVDAASLKFRTESMGYNGLKTLQSRMDKLISENSSDEKK